MRRITIKNLEALCDHLNEITGSPKTSWTRQADGRLKANIGNHHISQAYGGACVHKMMNESGGVTTPITFGHVPKRELYELMQAYIHGFHDTKETDLN